MLRVFLLTILFVCASFYAEAAKWTNNSTYFDITSFKKKDVPAGYPNYVFNLSEHCKSSKSDWYSNIRVFYSEDFLWGSRQSYKEVRLYEGYRKSNGSFEINVSSAAKSGKNQSTWIRYKIPKGKDLFDTLKDDGVTATYRSGTYRRTCTIKISNSHRVELLSSKQKIAALESLSVEQIRLLNSFQRFGTSKSYAYDFNLDSIAIINSQEKTLNTEAENEQSISNASAKVAPEFPALWLNIDAKKFRPFAIKKWCLAQGGDDNNLSDKRVKAMSGLPFLLVRKNQWEGCPKDAWNMTRSISYSEVKKIFKNHKQVSEALCFRVDRFKNLEDINDLAQEPRLRKWINKFEHTDYLLLAHDIGLVCPKENEKNIQAASSSLGDQQKNKEEQRQLAELEKQRKAEEEQRQLAELEKQRKAEEEQRQLAELEKQRKAEEEQRQLAELEKQRKAEEEQRQLAELEKQRKAEEKQRQLAELEKQRKAEEKQRQLAELEKQRKAEEEQRQLAELEKQRKAEEVEAKKLAAADKAPPQIFAEVVSQDGYDAVVRGVVSDDTGLQDIAMNGQLLIVDSLGGFEKSVYIPRGGELIVIEAIDKMGKLSRFELRLERQQIAKLELASFEKLSPSNRRVKLNRNAVAVIIGIANYQRTEVPAIFADQDARFFYDYATLKLGVPEQNIIELVNEEANEIEIALAVENFLKRKIKVNTTDVYIFFAGHGLATDDGSEMYLLPYDGAPQLLEKTAVARKQLFNDIALAKPNSVTVFLDTCYSGTTRGTETLIASRPIAIRALEQSIPDNFTVMTAAAGDQTAKPLEEAKHGMFSYFLMKGMEGEADANNDNQITAGELHAYVEQNVVQQSSGSQTPELQGDASRVLVRFQ